MITRRPGDGAGPPQRRENFERLEREIVGEKAAALGRAGERLEHAIAEAHDIAAAVRRADDPEARARLGREYAAARGRAQRARLALLIQREALGLRHHAVVDQEFPEPPREPR
jgi:hypothetical protein